MSKFDFDSYPNKYGLDYAKYDVKPNEIPLSIADMDFFVSPKIKEALLKRVELGSYGYVYPKEELFDAYNDYYLKMYNFDIKEARKAFSLGVLPSLSSLIKSFSNKGDYISTLTPAYNCFFNEIRDNDRNILKIPLVYKDDKYCLDLDLVEEAFKKSKIFILCSPHNPTGYIFSKDELITIARLAKQYGVLVISDEIHSPLIKDKSLFTPFLSSCKEAKEVGIVLFSPTKGWNIAGIQTSLVYSFNKAYMDKVDFGLNRDDAGECNFFSSSAAIAALNSLDWLEEANEYISNNRLFLSSYIHSYISLLKLVDSSSTYLAWVDISSLKIDADKFIEVCKDHGLIISSGSLYGDSSFIRLNLAVPKSVLTKGLDRLKEAVESL